MKIGDRVISDLDGKSYTIHLISPRDEAEPLPGVKQIGNLLVLIDEAGNKTAVYDWEVEVIF